MANLVENYRGFIVYVTEGFFGYSYVVTRGKTVITSKYGDFWFRADHALSSAQTTINREYYEKLI